MAWLHLSPMRSEVPRYGLRIALSDYFLLFLLSAQGTSVTNHVIGTLDHVTGAQRWQCTVYTVERVAAESGAGWYRHSHIATWTEYEASGKLWKPSGKLTYRNYDTFACRVFFKSLDCPGGRCFYRRWWNPVGSMPLKGEQSSVYAARLFISWAFSGIQQSLLAVLARSGAGWWTRNSRTTVSGCVRSFAHQRHLRERYRTNWTKRAANFSPILVSQSCVVSILQYITLLIIKRVHSQAVLSVLALLFEHR